VDYQVLSEGRQLNFLIDACHPEIGDVEVVETAEQITVTLNEVYFPPTTSEAGEVDDVGDCQSAFRIDLDSPWDERTVIDGSDNEVLQRVP